MSLRIFPGSGDFNPDPLRKLTPMRRSLFESSLTGYYREPLIRLVVSMRTLCIAGRARAAVATRERSGMMWLCAAAPLWVVVHACMLLRDDGEVDESGEGCTESDASDDEDGF